jgi:hypothetical protein
LNRGIEGGAPLHGVTGATRRQEGAKATEFTYQGIT